MYGLLVRGAVAVLAYVLSGNAASGCKGGGCPAPTDRDKPKRIMEPKMDHSEAQPIEPEELHRSSIELRRVEGGGRRF